MSDKKNKMFALMAKSWNGPMASWVRLSYLVVIIMTGVGVWLCIESYNAASVDDRIFWGVWLLLDITAIGVVKLWLWIHMMGFAVKD